MHRTGTLGSRPIDPGAAGCRCAQRPHCRSGHQDAMPNPDVLSTADPHVGAAEWDVGRVVHRHRQCLELAEHALERAASDTERRTLVAICAFHRRRADLLAERFEKATTGYQAPE